MNCGAPSTTFCGEGDSAHHPKGGQYFDRGAASMVPLYIVKNKKGLVKRPLFMQLSSVISTTTAAAAVTTTTSTGRVGLGPCLINNEIFTLKVKAIKF